MIDYNKISDIKKGCSLTKDEFSHLKDLVQTMELINARKSTLTQILEKIMERQKSYLDGRDPGMLRSLTQLELARELDIHSSTISRVVSGKSILSPWNEEIPLKVFLVKGPVNQVKSALYSILSEEEKQFLNGKIQLPYRDDEIKNLLAADFRLEVATRTVAKYRAEIGLPNIYERAKSYLNEGVERPWGLSRPPQ